MIASNKNGRGFFSFLRRGEQWYEVSGYQVGDIQSDKPVLVTLGATVLGDIIAPRVTVAGLLCGAAVARETIVEADGQVWGDVYTNRLTIEPGGKIQGWTSTLDEATYQSLQASGALPDETGMPDPSKLPAEVVERNLRLRIETPLDALHRLQLEAAAALAARVELEQTFDKRLAEVAGEAAARAFSLGEDLTRTRTELAQRQQQIAAMQEKLRTRDSQIERQTDELATARELLTEQNHQLEELQQAYEARCLELEQLQAAKTSLDMRLEEALKQVDHLSERTRNLETALQGSLQHSAEQEESLLRWQELAEDSETRVRELERALDQNQRDLEENARVTEILRAQRRQAEEEWQNALAELEAIRLQSTDPPAPSADNLLQEAAERISQLETALAGVEEKAQEYYDHILWQEASLETARIELDHTRQLAAHQESELLQLQIDAAAQQKLVAQWKEEATQTNVRLHEQEQRLQSLQANVKSWQQETAAEQEAARAALRQSHLQLEAHEVDLQRYLQEIEGQGRRLAETHAALIEREIQLKQAQDTIEKQSQLIRQMKQVTGDHINDLETRLVQTQRQLQDALSVLARRQRP